jgi:hypothetical protein
MVGVAHQSVRSHNPEDLNGFGSGPVWRYFDNISALHKVAKLEPRERFDVKNGDFYG